MGFRDQIQELINKQLDEIFLNANSEEIYIKLHLPNGEIVYDGGIKNANRDGKGILYNDTKIVYDGLWSNDRRDGTGTSFVDGIKKYEVF